ncbi:putative TIM-barrel fold metal-dependent hydrolase [Saccharomonospora marina XMU15]|uniref:Putative TIM-barrel fold metal-dependent hydrolase n=1 Tax=Saccharomonospora marina XMU15 TaxID=882083 RepID=H5WYR3_9PSEU|nr:amidohydrolase family protein [Saccharomonospora marina]EHR50728.1 putative TIM-barrel fold metal-dependent hydrolase [Saccharomonospora marina XMU15]
MTATAVTTAAVDTEVHCAPASFADLEPYLDPYWRTYVVESGLSLSPTQGGAYPPQAPTSATASARAAGVFPPRNVEQLRADVLDARGLRAAVLTCTASFPCNRNPYYEAALTSAVNDWLISRWLESDHRLKAGMVVPTLDTDAAVAEIERIGDHPGIVQVLLPVRTDAPWGNRRHRPLLRAAAERGLVVGLHAWGRIANAASSTGLTHSYLEDYLGNSQVVAQAQVTSLVAEGVFTELPDLRVSLLECGFSWLPALLWRFDKDWKGVWREVPWVTAKPSEIVRKHLRLTTLPAHLPRDPAQAREVLDLVDAKSMLLYASDYPHDHGGGHERLAAALTAEETDAIYSTNPAHWYRLD